MMDLDNINKPFIWRKKYEELGIKVDEKQIEEESRKRAEANRIELEKIRERQRKRELEYRQKLSDNELIQRQKEAEQHEHWEQQEDSFILRQHRQRSKIRIRDGRAKPIDLFAHYIDVFGFKVIDQDRDKGYVQEENIDLSDSPVELLNPCDWFNGLKLSDLESLEPDIEIYMNADCDQNRQYWMDILDITRNEMAKLRAVKDLAEGCDINSAVLSDVTALFEGKSISELDDLQREMMGYLGIDDPSVDRAFYKSAIGRLKAYRAEKRLTSNHKNNLRRQKDKILEEKNEKAQQVKVEATAEGEPEVKKEEEEEEGVDEHNLPLDKYEESQLKCIEEYKKGGYSPKMLRKNQLDPGIVLTDFKEEFERLTRQRNTICHASTLDEAKMATMTSEEREFMKAASKDMNSQEESTFSCEAPVRGADNRIQTYIWADKYQPRKPRYFNRVHTGFEWNKYNQTHYDVDNPPPKVVQGYKFNIFYPDLIDKSKAPEFTITPCKDDKDFCTIRFSAGPPYEDIAFRIVNREWNNSHKSGYRCQFINNMLQLWFQFKRYRYRR